MLQRVSLVSAMQLVHAAFAKQAAAVLAIDTLLQYGTRASFGHASNMASMQKAKCSHALVCGNKLVEEMRNSRAFDENHFNITVIQCTRTPGTKQCAEASCMPCLHAVLSASEIA